jgi:hypothetical protein
LKKNKIMLSLFLIASAFAQNCEDTNFAACLDIGKDYLENTCGSLRTNGSTTTYYSQCLCYQKVSDANCYGICPSDASVQVQFASVATEIISLCQAAYLDPKKLVYPAPWAPKVPAPTSPINPTGSTVSTGTTGAVSSPNVKKNGASLAGIDYLVALGYGKSFILISGIIQFVL